jgi:hypothetical protein
VHQVVDYNISSKQLAGAANGSDHEPAIQETAVNKSKKRAADSDTDFRDSGDSGEDENSEERETRGKLPALGDGVVASHGAPTGAAAAQPSVGKSPGTSPRRAQGKPSPRPRVSPVKKAKVKNTTPSGSVKSQ